MTNRNIAELLREVAIAYQILGENRFRINAYAQAADSIENLGTDIEKVWKQGDLQNVPGVGGALAQHLDELFQTGQVKHFNELKNKMPKGMYELLKLRSVGPKTAFKLATILGDKQYDQTKSIQDRLTSAIKNRRIQDLEGFGQKREQDILEALTLYKKGIRKKKRILLSDADVIVQRLSDYLQKDTNIVRYDFLGSYRRRSETIGDIDIAIATKKPLETIKYFVQYPQTRKIIDQGDKGATILIDDNVQIDLRVINKSRYGSMLQYFTGSKYHNIRLREFALDKGLSLSEWGIKSKVTDKTKKFSDEKLFYQYLKIPWIPPEMRENRGEVELAIKNKLPNLVKLCNIKADMHIHSDYEYPSSHDQGESSVEELLKNASDKEYEYIGLADHNPKQSKISIREIVSITKDRTRRYKHLLYDNKLLQKYNKIKKVYILYEVDIKPNGEIALPISALEYLDGIIISLHSSFRQTTIETTNRLLKALQFPKVRVVGHPTGRLINSREPVKADWHKIFTECKKKDIALEINSSPTRLDLSDRLAYEALKVGCRLIINTDSHHKDQMSGMRYGVSVARRAWSTKSDILNTLSFEKFDKWFMRR